MDLFDVKTLLFLLSFTGCCAGQSILPVGPVDAVLGTNVTFQTLVNKPDYSFIIWNFNKVGVAQPVPVATLPLAGGLKVNTPYTGRVAINNTTGFLYLGPVKTGDSGYFTITIISPDGTTITGETELQVLDGPDKAEVQGKNAVEVNDNVVLTCSADSIPSANFTWKFNGSDTGVRTAQFRLEMAAAKDIGKYTCEANNAVTGKTATSTHSLTIHDPGTLHEGLSDGAIAGIVIGILVALAIGIGLIVYCRQKVPVYGDL